jgi:hypothetical protein
MWRSLLILLVAAAVGGLAGTIGVSLIMGGTGAPDTGRFILGLSVSTMMFTVPGAIMLAGLQPSWLSAVLVITKETRS